MVEADWRSDFVCTVFIDRDKIENHSGNVEEDTNSEI